MSEQKRATLLTISTQKGDVKKVKEKSKTIRFCLTLPESNEKSCPEYNYKDLLNSAEKKNKGKLKNDVHVNGLNPGLKNLDPFDDDDADVIRISKQFEEKYGGGIPKKKRRGNKKDDYVDIGAGYDESDSFIDNTDAYDEMVPADITTVHGGFYINSGALEFKQVEYSGSEDSSDSDKSQHSNINNTTNRKRIIEDSEESESEDEKDEIKSEHVDKKVKIETNGGIHKQPTAKKKLTLDDNKEKDAKKRKIDENLLKKKALTVKDLLREKREELDVTIEIDKDKENKPSGNGGSSSTINDAIESVINAVRAKNVNETSKESVVNVITTTTTTTAAAATVAAASIENVTSNVVTIESDQSSRDQNDYDQNIPIVKLPDNVPSHILEIVNNIKKAAENSSEGKVKFFTAPVNKMLLALETHSRKLTKAIRVAIYEHLAPFVRCKKDTLMRRAKSLLLDHETTKYQDAMRALQAHIDNQMPAIKKNYERECQKVRDEMFLASANAANATANPSASANGTNGENGDINCKIKRIPRKKFPWSEEARNIFQELITAKKRCFPLEGNRKETFETYLEQFLKNDILPLWPEGWISIAALNKQVKIIIDNNVKQKMLKTSKTMKPISLDISAIPSAATSTFHSPVRKSPSGISVIPIAANHSPKAVMNNGPGPKVKLHSPSELSVTTIINHKSKQTDSNATTTTTTNNSSVLNLSAAEISAVLPKDNSVTITSVVDARTSNISTSTSTNTNPILTTNDLLLKTTSITTSSSSGGENNATKTVIIEQPTNLKQRIVENISKESADDENDDCQIIDLTDTPVALNRKPGPKSKTRNADGTIKIKRPKVSVPTVEKHKEGISLRKTEELTGGNQALNHLITGLTKYGGASTEQTQQPKETPNEDDMEQVMKDLKELQQMQEHARHDLDVMSPSSSPVSVIAYNSNYSPSKMQADDLSTKVTTATSAATGTTTATARRQSSDGGAGAGAGVGLSAGAAAFQDIFQKALYQDSALFKTTNTTTSSLYNSQQKTNYNSVNNFPGTISNSMNNIRYSQSSSKYPTNLSHLSSNTTGSKQKSPP